MIGHSDPLPMRNATWHYQDPDRRRYPQKNFRHFLNVTHPWWNLEPVVTHRRLMASPVVPWHTFCRHVATTTLTYRRQRSETFDWKNLRNLKKPIGMALQLVLMSLLWYFWHYIKTLRSSLFQCTQCQSDPRGNRKTYEKLKYEFWFSRIPFHLVLNFRAR